MGMTARGRPPRPVLSWVRLHPHVTRNGGTKSHQDVGQGKERQGIICFAADLPVKCN